MLLFQVGFNVGRLDSLQYGVLLALLLAVGLPQPHFAPMPRVAARSKIVGRWLRVQLWTPGQNQIAQAQVSA